MLFPALSVLLMGQLVAGIAVRVGAQYNAFTILSHSIVEYLNSSQAVNWTEGTTEDTGAKYIKTRIDMDTWKTAAEALSSSFGQTANVDHLDVAVATAANGAADTYAFSSDCYHHGIGVQMSEITRNIHHIQDEVLKSGALESTWYGFDHPSLPDITMWYSTSIYQWVDALPKGLIVDMFTHLLWAACGPPWKALGGVDTVRERSRYSYVAQVEFYASKK
jgi:hypothetical protein